ncbi:MAG: DUF4293 domain-containing protein [Prevotellaceae bacterium]|nr:DUF4293 domain-containing protein [Prevotellaceae bacterium]
MIQRIQTVYLLIATLLAILASLFTVRMGALISYTHWSYAVLRLVSILIPIYAFSSILLFKKRNLQMAFVWIVVFLILIYYITVLFLFKESGYTLSLFSLKGHCGLLINLPNPVLCFLAIKAIRYDENLIKAADRLR